MKQLRRTKNSNLPKWLANIGLGIFLFAFSINTGVSHFNYIPDVIKIVVKESSPPSLALAEVNADVIDNTIAANIAGTPLKVGLALLPQIELEEILIGELDQADSQFVNPSSIVLADKSSGYVPSVDDLATDLSSEQMIRLRQAQQKYRVLNQSWVEPEPAPESLGEKVKRISQNIEASENIAEKNKTIIRGDAASANHKNSGSFLAESTLDSEHSKANIASSNKVAVNGTVTDPQLAANITPINTQPVLSADVLTIDGLIEFARKADLVLTPEHRIEVRRFAEGVPQEFGIVKLPEATFNIQFQSKYGSIVAQLINANGIVEGQGAVSIHDVLNSKNMKPTLIIKPAPKGNIQVASAYGPSFQKDFQKNISFDIFGAIDYSKPLPKENYFDHSHQESEAVVQANAKNHIATTAVISLADGADLMVLPEKMINGLADILTEQGVSLNLQAGDSLIWGQVRKDGKPIEGASIFAERTDPIYFGGMQLPDQLRTSTSDNGMFVVVVNEPGWKDLYIQLENGAKMHLNVLTFPGKVAQVFADLPTRDIAVSIRSFDAFSGDPTRAKVQIQQIEDIVDTGDLGLSVVNIPFTDSLSFVNVYPESPYVDAKFSYTKMKDYLHLPMVRKDWMDEIARYLKINTDPQKGTVIGFVQNENFILVPSAPEQSQENLVYFDSKGQIVPSGSAGGGFILYNQPSGFVGVTIEDQKLQRKFHRISFPENRFVSILNFNL